MNILKVLHKPIITEKTYKLMQKDVYVFEVNLQAEKFDVKKSFEAIFDVKVAKVNLIKYHRKPKKMGKYEGFRSGFKKAFITLKPGEKLQILKEETEAAVQIKTPTEKKGGVFSKFKDVFLKTKSDQTPKTKITKNIPLDVKPKETTEAKEAKETTNSKEGTKTKVPNKISKTKATATTKAKKATIKPKLVQKPKIKKEDKS